MSVYVIATIISHLTSPHCTLGDMSVDWQETYVYRKMQTQQTLKAREALRWHDRTAFWGSWIYCGYQEPWDYAQITLRGGSQSSPLAACQVQWRRLPLLVPRPRQRLVASFHCPRCGLWRHQEQVEYFFHFNVLHILRGFLSTNIWVPIMFWVLI